MHKLLLLLPLALAAQIHTPGYAQTTTSGNPVSRTASADTAAVAKAEPLTLPAALALAFRANPEIAAARREIEATEGAINQAGVLRNPELSASIEDTKQATRTTTVQLNQPIELGGKRAARISAAERGRDAAVVELAGKKSDVRAAVVTAFYDVVTAQERYRLAQDSATLAQRATSVAAKRVLAGKVSPVEETRARVAESGVRIELIQAASELDTARRRLFSTWGGMNDLTPRMVRAESHGEELPALPPLGDLVRGLQQSPSLIRARAEIDHRQALTKVERTRQIPDITLSVGAKRDEQLGRNQVILGVSLPLPLFDRNQGNLLEALRRTDKARDELTATEIRLASELGQAHGRLNAARQEADLLQRETLPGAQSAYEATTKGFELGKFSFLEVLDAQRTFFQAKSQYLRALAETHRTAAEIDRLVGTPFAIAGANTKQQEQQ
jgi:outer membrane protein, heavy metal efflux system